MECKLEKGRMTDLTGDRSNSFQASLGPRRFPERDGNFSHTHASAASSMVQFIMDLGGRGGLATGPLMILAPFPKH